MKTCLLNLPHPTRIIRRYSCTYNAPNFLFPPLELMSLGAIIKSWKKDSCVLIDAIAQRLSVKDVLTQLKEYQPDLLVFMAGIETFKEDLLAVAVIKSQLPNLKIACIGHLPSVFPQETLKENNSIDYVIIGEPELSFSEAYDALKTGKTAQEIDGIAWQGNSSNVIAKSRNRIKDLDALPFPDRSLIDIDRYNEFLLPRPFATIQTMRGCPFGCSFCVNTYGREVSQRSLASVLLEIEELVSKYKIKSLRFMDDTFTLEKSRVMELCERLLAKGLRFSWSCLSRVDTVDNQMLVLMKKAGCKRVYLGIESASQRILDYYKKGYQAAQIKDIVSLIRKNNIQAAGFFIVGGMQTKEELLQDISLAKEVKLDFVAVQKLSFYPGTSLNGDTLPGGSAFGVSAEDVPLEWERRFYRDFYLRPGYILNRCKDLFLYAGDILLGAMRVKNF